MRKSEKFYLDVMLNNKFYCQVEYYHCPLFPIEYSDLEKRVLQKYPTLRNKKFIIEISKNRV